MVAAPPLMPFAAELLTPLSPLAKTLGTLLGVAVVVAGGWLLWSQRRADRAPGFDSPLGARLIYRGPIAGVLVVLGMLVLAGVWIDVVRYRNQFVAIWMAVMFLTAVVLCFAGFDLLVVNRRAYERRMALVEESRARLREEIAQYRRRPPATEAAGLDSD